MSLSAMHVDGRRARSEWTPQSWRALEAKQQPVYGDPSEAERVVDKLRQFPPLVSIGEVARLRSLLGEAAMGRRFILQCGDCAERFDDLNSTTILRNLKIMMQLSLVLSHAARLSVVHIGRFAGQLAKPRSADVEHLNGLELLPYRGDLINGLEATPEARRPDPKRMERGYFHSAVTLNFARALIEGGFASLGAPEHWELDWVADAGRRAEYAKICERVTYAIDYYAAISERLSRSEEHTDRWESLHHRARRIELFASHEGLLLPYEEAMTRRPREGGQYYNLGAHFLWIGDRTRQLDGAHVEYFRGLGNPIGIKIGPSCSPDELVELLDRLDPTHEPGRVSLITRYGSQRIAEHLPQHARAVARSGHRPVWICDPMHGNTLTMSGVKTRKFADVLDELKQAFQIHQSCGGTLNGVHFELTGDQVTECIGGSEGIGEEDLRRSYLTGCDPRLNYRQSLEMAFLISETLGAQRPRESGAHPW